jgi:hypothetical protein
MTYPFNNFNANVLSSKPVAINTAIGWANNAPVYPGSPATIPGADWFNNVSDELNQVVTSSNVGINTGNATVASAIQSSLMNFCVATGTANAITANGFKPTIPKLVSGMELNIQVAATNTGATTLTVGSSTFAVQQSGLPLSQGELVAGNIYSFLIDGSIAHLTGSSAGTENTTAALSGTHSPQWQQLFAGNNASYNNVAGSRALSTNYTNSSGRPILVLGQLTLPSGSNVQIFVNGSEISAMNFSNTTTIYPPFVFVVPAGQTYNITNSGGSPTISFWMEL